MGNVTVLGAGHWGLALSEVLASNGNDILVYGRNNQDMQELNSSHVSKYFKNFYINTKIKGTSNLEEAFNHSDTIVIALPIVVIHDTLKDLLLKYPSKVYVFTSKGLYKGQSMSKNFLEINSKLKLAVLSGPSFSQEVMEHKYTAVSIASNNEAVALDLQKLFTNSYFRVYTSDDLIGLEYCGAIKNVFAIVCGMIDGANMGSNTKNALVTRALSEMEQVIKFVGGNIKTLHGLAGIGDIMLTCNSFESRNYSFGFNYVRNNNSESAGGIVEGLNTIKEIHDFSIKNNLDLPIVNSLYNILYLKSNIETEALNLMGRKVKSE